VKIGVFGAPTYVLDGELFWGQDRLQMLEWRLTRKLGAPKPTTGGVT
jgi:carboxymethylenebutenolidase